MKSTERLSHHFVLERRRKDRCGTWSLDDLDAIEAGP
jgi:hypothetical protein